MLRHLCGVVERVALEVLVRFYQVVDFIQRQLMVAAAFHVRMVLPSRTFNVCHLSDTRQSTRMIPSIEIDLFVFDKVNEFEWVIQLPDCHPAILDMLVLQSLR